MKRFLLLFTLLTGLSALAQTDLTRRLDSLTAAYEANGFHGVILVAKGDKVLYEKGYGLANFDKKIKNTPNTIFKTESVGKMFTATAILQLVESGKLRLDQTVKELLPDLKIKNADKITVNHLLRHTSGLQSPWDHPQWTFKKDFTRAELQKIIEEVPTAFDTPGKEMFYSNSGYVVLSWIVEKVSGQPFDQYYQEHIFSPLHMTATRHLNDTVMPISNGAQPYKILNSKRYLLAGETVGGKASGAGGWISTAHDLYNFMQGLSSGKLIKLQTWEIMRTANHTAPKDSQFRFYAYGLETYHNQLVPGADLFGHNGGGAGFSIDAFVDPVSGYIVTSCTNLFQNSRPIAANYFKAAMGQPLQPVKPLELVKLYDKIEEKGIDAFTANGAAYFKELGIEPRPGLFALLGDIMQEAGDYTTRAKWMEYGGTLYPEESQLLLLRGDSQAKIGNKEAARKLYQTAKEISAKKNEQWLTQIIDEKLKTL
jgi:CubicO group peptidase (beta-lactamase class C family)